MSNVVQLQLIAAHPIAEIFPLMTGEEFDALVADMGQHGQREPIIMLDGLIVDGRNRARACRQLGIEPRTVEWAGPGEVGDFIISANLHRRHLSGGQRAMVAARLAAIRHGEVGRNHPRNPATQIRVSEAAKALNVGTATVSDARCVLNEGTPEEIADVMSGQLAVTTLAPAIRKRRVGGPPKIERKRPTTSAERQEKLSMYAAIWAQLDAALHALTSLPRPADVAKIVSGHPKRRSRTEARLSRATHWLEEFNRAYTDAEKERQQPPPDGDRARDPGEGNTAA